MNTPVALIIFNRPDLTRRILKAISGARPSRLLVIADGPRNQSEAALCAECRAIINEVDWECEVQTNYSEVNLGCKQRVSSGLDWVFSQVEEAIILEDDCEPAPSFFTFCEKMLERYRNDTRIMHISGSNFVASDEIRHSYYFSRYIHIWGWATWRRAWQHYDVQMRRWPEARDNILASCADSAEAYHWNNSFNAVYKGEIDTWDSQWHLACWLESGLAVVPRENLISNLGFREDATHTILSSPLANLPVGNWQCDENKPPYVMADFRTDALELPNWITLRKREIWKRQILKLLPFKF